MAEKRSTNPIRDLPLPALFVLIAALWIAVQLIFAAGSINPIKVAVTVIGGIVFSAISTAVVAGSRRRLGSTRQVTAFSKAFRTGSIPAEADTERWKDELDRLDHGRTRRTLLLLGGSIPPLGFGIWALTDPDARPIGALLILLFATLDIAVLLSLRTERRRTQRLRQNLDTALPQ